MHQYQRLFAQSGMVLVTSLIFVAVIALVISTSLKNATLHSAASLTQRNANSLNQHILWLLHQGFTHTRYLLSETVEPVDSDDFMKVDIVGFEVEKHVADWNVIPILQSHLEVTYVDLVKPNVVFNDSSNLVETVFVNNNIARCSKADSAWLTLVANFELTVHSVKSRLWLEVGYIYADEYKTSSTPIKTINYVVRVCGIERTGVRAVATAIVKLSTENEFKVAAVWFDAL